jgi:ABC-type microcin C transport system permease subunit YejB
MPASTRRTRRLSDADVFELILPSSVERAFDYVSAISSVVVDFAVYTFLFTVFYIIVFSSRS